MFVALAYLAKHKHCRSVKIHTLKFNLIVFPVNNFVVSALAVLFCYWWWGPIRSGLDRAMGPQIHPPPRGDTAGIQGGGVR
jgi:hypothetical protein